MVGIIQIFFIPQHNALGTLGNKADSWLVHAACGLGRRFIPHKHKPRHCRFQAVVLLGLAGNIAGQRLPLNIQHVAFFFVLLGHGRSPFLAFYQKSMDKNNTIV